IQAPELLGQIGGQAERVRETALAPAGERPLRLREGSARAGAGEVQARQLEADRGFGAEQALHRLDQRLRRLGEPARDVEMAAAALPLLARRVLPDPARAAERLDRFARAVHLLEAVAAAEEAEVVGREGGEGAVVPAQRLRPLLLALEVPADGAVEHGRAPRGELGAAQEVALDLLLVAEQAEGAADLVEELGRVPGLALGRVVDRAVARDDGVQL